MCTTGRYAKSLTLVDLRRGINKGHPTTPIPKVQKPSQRKGVVSQKTKFVRSVVREVAGFSAYERRVMELLRNSKVRGLAEPWTVLTVRIGQEGTQADQETRTLLLFMCTRSVSDIS